MTRIFLFMAILRSTKRSLHACRIFQARHNGLSRVVLAPGFHVLNVFLMCDKVYCCLAKLVTEPTAHPGRKVARLGWSHSEILLAPDVGHFDSKLCVGRNRKNPDQGCEAHQSEYHRFRPIAVTLKVASFPHIFTAHCARFDWPEVQYVAHRVGMMRHKARRFIRCTD